MTASLSDLPHWLRERRADLGLRQDEVARLTALHGGEAGCVTQPYLSRLERGTRPLNALTPARQDALRRALEISASEWVARTGLPLLSTPGTGDELLTTLDLIRVPVRALASAGLPLSEDHGSVIDHELVPGREFRPGMLVLEVQGDSMSTGRAARAASAPATASTWTPATSTCARAASTSCTSPAWA